MGQFSSSMLLSDVVKQLPRIISYAYRIWIFESLDLLFFSFFFFPPVDHCGARMQRKIIPTKRASALLGLS